MTEKPETEEEAKARIEAWEQRMDDYMPGVAGSERRMRAQEGCAKWGMIGAAIFVLLLILIATGSKVP